MRLIAPTPGTSRGTDFFPFRYCAHGFTLIELMTVLVLIAILSAMIIPEMKGTFGDALLRSTARELVNVIELASSRAVSLNQTLRVKLDPSTGRYEVERRRREHGVEDFAPLQDVAGSQGSLDKRISIQFSPMEDDSADPSTGPQQPAPAQDNTLAFNPDGTADAVMILLKDRAGFRLALRVNPITSRVTITEPSHE